MMVTTGGSSPWAAGGAPVAALQTWEKSVQKTRTTHNIRLEDLTERKCVMTLLEDLLWNSARKYSPYSFIKLEKLLFRRGMKSPAVNSHCMAQNQNLSIGMDCISLVIIVETA